MGVMEDFNAPVPGLTDGIDALPGAPKGIGGFLKSKVRPFLESVPPVLAGNDDASKLASQVYSGLVDSGTLGYLKPRTEDPEGMAQKLAHASGSVGGFVIPYSRIASIVKAPAVAGAVMGVLSDTTNKLGSKEDIISRAKNAGYMGAQMWALGKAGEFVNEKITARVLDGAFRSLAKNPGKAEVFKNVVNDMTIGFGLGASEETGTERTVNDITGSSLPGWANMTIPFSSPDPKLEVEQRIANAIIGSVSGPVGTGMAQQLGRLAKTGDMSRSMDVLKADQAELNRRFGKPVDAFGEMGTQPGEAMFTPDVDLGVKLGERSFMKTLYPEYYAQGVNAKIDMMKAEEASRVVNRAPAESPEVAPEDPAQKTAQEIQDGKIEVKFSTLMQDETIRTALDALHFPATKENFQKQLRELSKRYVNGERDADSFIEAAYSFADFMDHSLLQSKVDAASPDRQFSVMHLTEEQKRGIADLHATDGVVKRELTQAEMDKWIDDNLPSVPKFSQEQQAMREVFGDQMTPEKLAAVYSGGTADVVKTIKAKISEMLGNDNIARLLGASMLKKDGELHVVQQMIQSLHRAGLNVISLDKGRQAKEISSYIKEELKARGITPKNEAAKLDVVEQTSGVIDPAPTATPESVESSKALIGALTKNLPEIRGGSSRFFNTDDMSPEVRALEKWARKHEPLHLQALASEKSERRQPVTPEQEAVRSDWKAFSRARGYTDKEIGQYEKYLDSVKEGIRLAKAAGMDDQAAADEVQRVEQEAQANDANREQAVTNELIKALGGKAPHPMDVDGNVRAANEENAVDALLKNAVPHQYEKNGQTQPPHVRAGVKDNQFPLYAVIHKNESKYDNERSEGPGNPKYAAILRDGIVVKGAVDRKGRDRMAGGLRGTPEGGLAPKIVAHVYPRYSDAKEALLPQLNPETTGVLVELRGQDMLRYVEEKGTVRLSTGERDGQYMMEFFGDGAKLPKDLYVGVQYTGHDMRTAGAWAAKALPEGASVEKLILNPESRTIVDPADQEVNDAFMKRFSDAYWSHVKESTKGREEGIQLPDPSVVMLHNVHADMTSTLASMDGQKTVGESIMDGVIGTTGENWASNEQEASRILQDPGFYESILSQLKAEGVVRADAKIGDTVKRAFTPKSSKPIAELEKELSKGFTWPRLAHTYVDLKGLMDGVKRGVAGFPELADMAVRLMAKYEGSHFEIDPYGRVKLEGVKNFTPEDKELKKYLVAQMSREQAKNKEAANGDIKRMLSALEPMKEVYDQALQAIKSNPQALVPALARARAIVQAEYIREKFAFEPPKDHQELFQQHRIFLKEGQKDIASAAAWEQLKTRTVGIFDKRGRKTGEIERTYARGRVEYKGRVSHAEMVTAEAHQKKVNRWLSQAELIDHLLNRVTMTENAINGQPVSVGSLHLGETVDFGGHLNAISVRQAEVATEIQGLHQKLGVRFTADGEAARKKFYKLESDINKVDEKIDGLRSKVRSLARKATEEAANPDKQGPADSSMTEQVSVVESEINALKQKRLELVDEQRNSESEAKRGILPNDLPPEEAAAYKQQLKELLAEEVSLAAQAHKFTIAKNMRDNLKGTSHPTSFEDLTWDTLVARTHGSASLSEILAERSDFSSAEYSEADLTKAQREIQRLAAEEDLASQNMGFDDMPAIGGGSPGWGDFVRTGEAGYFDKLLENTTTGIISDPPARDAIEVIKDVQYERDLSTGGMSPTEVQARLERKSEAMTKVGQKLSDDIVDRIDKGMKHVLKMHSMDSLYDWKSMTFGERIVKGIGYWRDVASGRLGKMEAEMAKYNEPLWKDFTRAGEAIYFPDPNKPNWEFTERGKTEKLEGGMTRAELFQSQTDEYKRLVLDYRRVMTEKREAGIGMGVYTTKVREADRELGYMHTVPLDNKTGRPFSNAFKMGEANMKDTISKSHGLNDEGAYEGKKTSLDDRLKTGNREMLDPRVTLRHYLADFVNRSSAEYIIRNLENTYNDQGIPLMMFEGEKYHSATGMVLDKATLRKLTADGTMVKVRSEIGALQRYNEPAYVHRDLKQSMEDSFGRGPSYSGAMAGLARYKAFNKAVNLWSIGDNMMYLYGAATGAMGIMKATETFGRVLLGKPINLEQHEMEALQSGWHGSHQDFINALYDEWTIKPDMSPEQKNIVRRAWSTLEMLSKDKFGLDQQLFKMGRTISLAMWEHKRGELMAKGADRETANRLASDYVNTATFNRSKYALDKRTSEAARWLLISRNMATARIATLTGALGYTSLGESAIGKSLGLGGTKLDAWFSRNFGLRGYTEHERHLLKQTYIQHWQRIATSHLLGTALVSYMMTGSWPWEREFKDWFKIGTPNKDANGNGILVSNPMLKDFTDNQAFWAIPMDVLTGSGTSYLINKGDMTLAALTEVITGSKITSFGTKPINEAGAPFNEKVANAMGHIFYEKGPLGMFRNYVIRNASGDIDPLAGLAALAGFGQSKTLGGVGPTSVEYMKLMEEEKHYKHLRQKAEKQLDEYRRTGDPRYGPLLAKLRATPKAMLQEDLKAQDPLAYKSRSKTRNARLYKRLDAAEEML